MRAEHAEQIEQKKREALDAMSLMEDQVARKIAAERASDGRLFICGLQRKLISTGLIIVSAHYGLASAFTEKGFRLPDGDEVIIDVTVPVQALVQDGHLLIPGGRGKVRLLPSSDACTDREQFNILGFWASTEVSSRYQLTVLTGPLHWRKEEVADHLHLPWGVA